MVPDKWKLKLWIELVLLYFNKKSEVTIRIVNAEEISKINMIYRGKEKATNILSFPFDVPFIIKKKLLGDVIICKKIIKNELKKNALEAYWAHMVVHGILHLLGYNHVEKEKAAEMEWLERKIIQAIGYKDPYFM